MNKDYVLPSSYGGVIVRDVANVYLLQNLSKGAYYFFHNILLWMDDSNKIYSHNDVMIRIEQAILEKTNVVITSKTIKLHLKKMYELGVFIRDGNFILVNPFVVSRSENLHRDLYELFKHCKITKHCLNQHKIKESKSNNIINPLEKQECLYLLLFESDDDAFLKIGVTKNEIHVRYNKSTHPYTYRVLFYQELSNARVIEANVKKQFDRYYPKVDILRNDGATECLYVKDEQEIMNSIVKQIFSQGDLYAFSHLQN